MHTSQMREAGGAVFKALQFTPPNTHEHTHKNTNAHAYMTHDAHPRARAVDRIQPPLSEQQERRMIHNMLVYQSTMRVSSRCSMQR